MDTLGMKKKSGWEIYSSKEDRKAMNAIAEKFIQFLTASKTERETISNVIDSLRKAGFQDGFAGDKGFASLHGKALFAARKGRRSLAEGVRLISAHADSPRLDFKEHPIIEQVGIAQAKTHYYGGLRKYQWFAHPLAIHGIVVKKDGSILNICIGEDERDPVFSVDDILPHLAHDDSEKTLAKAFEGEKLNLIIGHEPLGTVDKEKCKEPVKENILHILNEKYGIREEDFISAELEVVPCGAARFVGLDKSIIGGYGQDDRICVFTALEAFLEAEDPEYTTCVIFWDKEEIGSEGSTGATSRFFQYTMEEMTANWEPSVPLRKVMLNTKAISADVTAAVDPDWQDRHDAKNSAYFGFGPGFCKFTGSKGKYGSSDAHAEYIAWLRKILDAKNIPWQMTEMGKVDIGGGGTVALFLASYGMDVIDCGTALLSMHSPFELSSVADLYATKQTYREFFMSSL